MIFLTRITEYLFLLHLLYEALGRLEARQVVCLYYHGCLLQDVAGCLCCTMFDDETSEREIARQTIQDPVPYPSQVWGKISKEARRFVDGLLRKNPSERMTIKQVLEHEWFKQYSKSPELRQKTKTRTKSLFSLYTNDDLTTGTNCK